MDAAITNADLPRKWVGLAVALLLLLYGAFLWRYAGVQPGGSDSSGYFNEAKMLAAGHVDARMPAIPGLPGSVMPGYAYVPLGFRPNATGTGLVPTYPIGLPLLLIPFIWAGGDILGPNALFVLHAILGVWLLYRLSRVLGFGRAPALVGATILSLSPLYVMHSLYAMSDVPALVWTTASVYFAWKSQSRTAYAAAAGLAIGLAVLLRPTCLLVLPALIVPLGGAWRRWLHFVVAGMPFALILLVFNRAAYGNPLSTGYNNLPELISLKWIMPTLRHYARYLPVIASPLVLLAVGLPFLWRRTRPVVLVLGLWILPTFGFYACYFHTHETWWYLRFLLPALPALIIAALLVAEQMFPAPHQVWIWAALGGVVVVADLFWLQQYHSLNIGQEESIYRDATQWVQTQVPRDSILVCMQMSGVLYYHTDHPLLRWDMLESSWPRVQAELARTGRPAYGIFFDFEERSALEERVPGHWTRIGQLRQVSLWRLAPTPAP